jgi:hypothetical protein
MTLGSLSDIGTLWFEVAVVTGIFAVGNILLGHFEEQTPKWRRVLKIALVVAVVTALSALLGRAWGFGFLAIMLAAALYVHAVWLPGKGVDGWTGEPRERLDELRGRKRDN